jgi:fructokinase
VSPQRVILGGGVMNQPTLLPLIRTRVRELIAGYVSLPELSDTVEEYLVKPALGNRAGVLGAIELARLAASTEA